MTHAIERELAALARSLPRFVTEEEAGELFRRTPRLVRMMVERGELTRGVAGTVTRVSILANLARRQGLDLDELELVLAALEEPPPPVTRLELLPGGVDTISSSPTT